MTTNDAEERLRAKLHGIIYKGDELLDAALAAAKQEGWLAGLEATAPAAEIRRATVESRQFAEAMQDHQDKSSLSPSHKYHCGGTCANDIARRYIAILDAERDRG